MRFLIATFLSFHFVVATASAQQEQTLADIRQELTVLFVEIQKLNRELSTTGGANVQIGGDTLDRVDGIERALKRLTSRTEQLEFRISQIVRDGTNRVGDLEFRLCELEPNCDLASLSETPSLGGGGEGSGPALVTPAPDTSGGAELAVGEQADFQRAKAALDAGDFQGAAEQFAQFAQSYPGGPMTSEAYFLRGEALTGAGDIRGAARAYLDAFSGLPNGRTAPSALLGLGTSLGQLGQNSEACLTLGEIAARFPGHQLIARAEQERARLGCL